MTLVPSRIVSSLCRVGRLAGPISSQAALVFVSTLVSLAFAGHLGGLALSQAVLASSCYNVTGAAVLLGLASGMETLCGQVRSDHRHMLLRLHHSFFYEWLKPPLHHCQTSACAQPILTFSALRLLMLRGDCSAGSRCAELRRAGDCAAAGGGHFHSDLCAHYRAVDAAAPPAAAGRCAHVPPHKCQPLIAAH